MAKDAQLEKYKRELETLEPKIAETELRKEQRAERIKKKKDEANTVEDRIFKDFCKQIGVENIRRFEEKQVRQQQKNEATSRLRESDQQDQQPVGVRKVARHHQVGPTMGKHGQRRREGVEGFGEGRAEASQRD